MPDELEGFGNDHWKKPLSASDEDNDLLLYSIVKDPTDALTTQTDDEKFSIDEYGRGS